MRVNVSLSLVLDSIGKVKLDLYNGCLAEVDEFTTRFKNSEEIRKTYKESIEEFLLEHAKMIDSFKGNKRGRIIITYLDNNLNTRFIPVLFLKDKKYTDLKYCYGLFKKSLKDDYKKLYEMVDKKYYIFSNYMKDLINYAKVVKSDKSYKDAYKEVLRIFSSSDNAYFYVRNLINYYRLLPEKIVVSKGVIRDIDSKLIESTISDKCDDEFFRYCADNENYEMLYNIYDVDSIIRNSKDKMNPIGSYVKTKLNK